VTVPQAHAPRRRWIKRAIVLALLLVLAAYVVHRAVPRGDAAAEIDRLVALLQLSPGMTVAEIGAGAGEMTVHMAETLGSASTAYATELNPERLDQIREKVRDKDLDHVTILEAGKAETNLPAECCDAIFMSKVYHHFTDPEAINRSLYDSLKPGGALAVIDFEPDVWNF
jgi:ubiquinone/menaquinone biosynthesis C-methylase UbiE